MSDLGYRRSGALLLWCLALAGQFAVPLLSVALSWSRQGASTLYYLLFIALPSLIYLHRRPDRQKLFRLNPLAGRELPRLILTAVLALFFIENLTLLWMILLQEFGVKISTISMDLPTGIAGRMLSILTTAALPSFFEELLFRGALLGSFERSGTRRALLFSTALFALSHGTLAGLPAQLLVGLIIGALVIYCDSIYAGMIYHLIHNALGLLMEFRSAPTETPKHLLTAVGGMSGLVTMLFLALILGMLLIKNVHGYRRRYHAQLIKQSTDPLFAGQIAPPRVRWRSDELSLLSAGLMLSALLYVTVYLS